MHRPARRAAGLLLGAAILFFVGTNVQAGWLFVLAALLLGTAAAGALFPGRMVHGLEVERRAPAEVFQGEEVIVDLAVTNPSRRSRFGLIVEDDLVARAEVPLPWLRPGERFQVSMRRRAMRRGPQGSEVVVVRSSAPFGVMERRRRVEAPGSTLVLPDVVPLPDLSFVEAVATHERAVHTWPRPGTGPEYLGVREYRPGDSPRHVHWPSTARHGMVMVRELEEERRRRLAVVVDSSADLDAGDEGRRTPLDRCCSAAASIALAAAARGQGTRLIATGPGELEVLGRGDEGDLLRALAYLSPEGGPPFPELVSSLDGAVRGAETAVLVFPTWAANASDVLGPAVDRLAAGVPRVVAIVVEMDPSVAGRRVLPPGGVARLAGRLADAGARVYVWTIAEDLAGCLAGGAVAGS